VRSLQKLWSLNGRQMGIAGLTIIIVDNLGSDVSLWIRRGVEKRDGLLDLWERLC
jgi:hypothetical protein